MKRIYMSIDSIPDDRFKKIQESLADFFSEAEFEGLTADWTWANISEKD